MEDMDITNTNRGVKRTAECQLVNRASISKVVAIASTSVAVEPGVDYEIADGASTSTSNITENASTSSIVGANLAVSGNARVSIGKITVTHQQILPQQPTPEHPPRGIDHQVTKPVASFHGRDEQLIEAKNAFNEQQNMESFNLVAVCGYGGIGKSEFARKYIQRNRTDFENIIWIFAESKDTIEASFNKLQKRLKDIGFICYEHQDTYKHLNKAKTLFVFDNVENMKSIRPFLPEINNDSLFLITSQFKTWSPYKSIALNELDSKNAINIMKAVLDTHKIEISEEQLQKLDSKLERIPLVIQIVAGFICQEVFGLRSAETEYDIDDIIQELDKECEIVTEEFPVFSTDPYMKSVYEALSRTLKKIWTKEDLISKTAATILGVSAYLSADFIIKRLLNSLLKIKNKILDKALAIVVQYSLFQNIRNEFRIHRTVQQCIRKYCAIRGQSNGYYLQTLPVLLNNDYMHQLHHAIVIQHGENEIETLTTFYEKNYCSQLQSTFFTYSPCIILTQLLNKVSLVQKPEFLSDAATSGRNDIMQVLRDRGINFDAKNDKGNGVLQYICLKTNFVFLCMWDTIKLVIELGAQVNSQNSSGCTVLHTVCELGQSNTANDQNIFNISILLIKEGANPEIRNSAGQTPVDLARMYELPLTFQLLESAILGYRYILHIAAKCRQFKRILELIQCKISHFNDKDNSGSTVFHVLAGLAQLDPKEEEDLVYKTVVLLRECQADVDINIKNDADETPADVARRCGRVKLTTVFNVLVPPGRIVYNSADYLMEQFKIINSEDLEYVDEQNDTGCTLLHALCDLDAKNHTELELDIAKLVARLAIWGWADVDIKNNAGDTVVDVARRRDRIMLADFLDTERREKDLVYVALRHREFDLVKYAWWRYFYFPSYSLTFEYPNELSCRVLRMLCDLDDQAVIDAELISLIDYMNLKQLAEYNKDEYYAAVEQAKRHGRKELVDWLQLF